VVPVLVINTIDHAVPLAKALVAGGVNVLEVTLRTPVAIEAIRRIAKEVPGAVVGAGTVATEADLNAVTEAGGVFAISPGLTPTLLKAAINGSIALIPGISTASELMLGMEYGLREFKFFPAEAAGGSKMLKALGGPFPQATFCPTGGISPDNYKDYLSLKNVACVGGSWLAPTDALEQGDYQKITNLARAAIA
jgi:2-dehydro-3-deoxyphosphogluconate aldolase/(4S)-4-hydroxy-2-oxoglutarate aldolase